MNSRGVDVHRVTQTADPLSGIRNVTHRGIDDVSPTAHAWDGSRDQL